MVATQSYQRHDFSRRREHEACDGVLEAHRSERGESRPTLYPLGNLILQLTRASGGDDPQMDEELTGLQPCYDELPTAVINGPDMYLDTAPYTDMSGYLQAKGFRFSDNPWTIRVRATDWPRPLPFGQPLSRTRNLASRNPALRNAASRRAEPYPIRRPNTARLLSLTHSSYSVAASSTEW